VVTLPISKDKKSQPTKNHSKEWFFVGCDSWSKFISMLEYKALWNDKQIVRIDRFFPSSKQCSSCGWINQDLDLSIREWTCPSCKTKLDRDLNASKNILKEGIKIISLGTNDYRCGDEIRPTNIGTIGETSKKKELKSPETYRSLADK